ncbi:MAG: hypothetical protein V4666_04985 [Bacteroidota bacterium]
MKKLSIYLMLLLLSVNIIPTSAYAEVSHTSSIKNSPKEIPAEAKVLIDRLKEIRKMDKSEMTRAEKKELRKEVKAIKTTLNTSYNGVYISVGAIIIIILLLILI